MEYIRKNNALVKDLKKNYQLYIFLIPAIVVIILFHYVPMYGVQIAFKNYSAALGIWGSPWVGLKHLSRFFGSHFFKTVMINTISITTLAIAFGFPIPIIFALLLNELKNEKFKKMIQTITYLPHFISITVLVSMMFAFFGQTTGIVNVMFGKILSIKPIPFMQSTEWFKTMFIASGIWQDTGYSSILYIAVLSTVDIQLHEAAIIDGANRFQRIIHINIPCIMPTATIMLILRLGSIVSVGFEKAFLMQNNLNLSVSEVLSTYVYRLGLIDGRYDFSTAVNLFTSVINCTMLLIVNFIAKRTSENSLW